MGKNDKKKGNQNPSSGNQATSSQPQPQSQQQSARGRQRPKNQNRETQNDSKTPQQSVGASSQDPKQQLEQPKAQSSSSLGQAQSQPQLQRQSSGARLRPQKQDIGTSQVPGITHPFESQPQSAWGPKQQSEKPSDSSFPQLQQSAKGRPRPKKQDLQTPVSHQEQQAVASAWLPQSQSNVPRSPHPFETQSQTAWGPQQSAWLPQSQSNVPGFPHSLESQSQSALGHQQPAWLSQGQSNVPRSPHPFESQSQSAWGPKQHSEQARTQSPTLLSHDQSHTQGARRKQRPRQQENQPQRRHEDGGNLPLADLSMSSTVSSSSQSSKSSAIPTAALMPLTGNKGSGKKGQNITVDVNFLPLIIDKIRATVYQYDVSIEPNLPKRLLPFIFENYRKKNFPNIFIAFDGNKIAVSPQILNDCESIEKETKVIDENGRERTYMVAIKEARDREIHFSSLRNYTGMRQFDAPLRAMQMLEIVLKSPFLNKNGVQAGRSFYMIPSERIELGDNYELWTGLYQSTVLGSRPYLNVDIAHKAFPTAMPVIDILHSMNVDFRRELSPRDKSALQSHLSGLMINYSMLGNEAPRRSYKFLGLNPNSKTFKFRNDEEKKEYILEDYFRSRKVHISYPFLQTLKLGNAIKNITVPLEFCSIAEHQVVNKKCTEMQTRNMIRVAATSTDERRKKIEAMLEKIAHNASPTLNQFGISVGSTFTNVKARILQPPTLEYKNRKTVLPAKGQWRIDNMEFLQPKNLTKFAVLQITDRSALNVRTFCTTVTNIGRSIGMNIVSDYDTYTLNAFSRNIDKELYSCMSDFITKNIELLFCVIPDRGDTYSRVKQCAELDCGILTQCIKSSTLLKKGTDQSTVTNILLKVNAKLNGINHKLASDSLLPMMKQDFMLIGADVTHPSPGQEHIPSVVGVVSSHDMHGFQYNKCWRLQDPKQEVIDDFANILKEHLEYYEKQRKCLPKFILYFRDGVSDGQFQQVLTTELNAMYRGCQTYRHNYKPKISFIVVQKRHHTRFFPPPPPKGAAKVTSPKVTFDKNNNVQPGTVVDTEITHPNECQLYLVSHQAIQGVARPTKYCVLRDDSEFSMDDLQALTFYLCHFFARCTRSVSYPGVLKKFHGVLSTNVATTLN